MGKECFIWEPLLQWTDMNVKGGLRGLHHFNVLHGKTLYICIMFVLEVVR